MTNTNTNTNARDAIKALVFEALPKAAAERDARARAAYIERARANEWEHGLEWIADYLDELAAELTGDTRANVLASLSYCQGDGVAIETTATIRRLDQGQPLEFTGLAKRVWDELTGAERRALGRFITVGGESVTLTSVHGNSHYYHKYTLDFDSAWVRLGRYNQHAPDYADAVLDRALTIFKRLVHELCDTLESTGYAEIEAALDYAEERAAEDWDAEHADAGGQV